MTAAVRLGDLAELVWVATLVTLVLVTAVAVGIRGSARATDLRREGRGGAAAGHAALAAVSYAVVAAGMVAGVLVIALG